MIDRLHSILAPWETLYAESTVLSTAVLTIHLVALLVGGGLALGADLATLRSSDGQQLQAVHRPVMLALVAILVSGLLMFAADVTVYATSIVFWLKMALVVALLFNGAKLYRAGTPLSARVSMMLWISITVLGAVLTSIG